ncbi:CotH kinase family protein [Mycolicibacterium frederiksbergense]|uniref:CotH kinase family protein n=1 Tax=Mycolicibacterium frederiksbergense TaxID=117567 RepID=UPI00265BFF05|nr:CotH kinase family protein [Mycolicibacterium frederiksbergense]MDO0977411.1 CotH kinase family protein [Mycolicibacterium frederiksbergense]
MVVDAPPKRRLSHRVPVRLRQHWKVLALLVAVAIGLTATLGQTRIRPYITGDVTIMQSEITDNIAGTVDLFDSTLPHSLTVEITEAEYQQMISAYQKDGDKKWMTADIVIDGTQISDVAVRLKGNSTLMGLGGAHAGRPDAPQGGAEAGPPGGMAGMAVASAEDPTTLPLLISFDENADGRGYQGLTELSVRPGTPVINEALSLSLTAVTGQPTQRYAYATYTINGQTTTRLLVEHPDATYANSLFDAAGYLYKADANSRLEYRGPDQSLYADQFKQINAADDGNLQPIINFLAWLDGAEQVEFDAHVSDWIDTDSFARYLATQNLLGNGDDMGGPGQNYYLWYDLSAKKISVISWDLNLAMNGDAKTQPGEEVQIGPAPGGEGMAPGGQAPKFGNQLKTRFLESEAWAPTNREAYWALYDQMYANGTANALLDEIAAAVPITDGLEKQTLSRAVDTVREWIAERMNTLDAARMDS